MSLKDKIIEKLKQVEKNAHEDVELARGIKFGMGKVMDEYYINVNLYLDARDNPEKHPDIVKEFEKSQGIQYSLLADVKDEGNQSWLSSIEYRDFLFKRLFQ